MRHSCGGGDQRGYTGCVSFVLTAPVAAVLHFIPVFGPLLAPFKGQIAARTSLRGEAVFDLGYA